MNPMTKRLPWTARLMIFLGQWLMAFISVAVIIAVLVNILGEWWRGAPRIVEKSLLISLPMVLIMSYVNPRWAKYIARKWPKK